MSSHVDFSLMREKLMNHKEFLRKLSTSEPSKIEEELTSANEDEISILVYIFYFLRKGTI